MMQKLIIIAMVVLLAACASRPFSWNTNDYTVKSGDTLYSIAWSYEIAPADLARWNNLSNTALIYAGQRLRMRDPREDKALENAQSWGSDSSNTSRASGGGRSTVKTVVVKKDETLYRIATKHNLTVKQIASYNNIRKPYVIKPGQRLKLGASKASASSRSNVSRQSSVSQSTKKILWQWPVKGRVIKSFNKRLSSAKGIDIAGKEGNSIKAAASGKVVYSGNGLINYGNLIIIKHNNQFLSAYAHNRKLLVKEGEKVKTGQVIAELGKTGAKNPRLHFEIRKNGKPVDPVRYLPRS